MNKILVLCLVVSVLGGCKKKERGTEAQDPTVQKPAEQGLLDAPVEHIKSLNEKVEAARKAQEAANRANAEKEAAAEEFSNVE